MKKWYFAILAVIFFACNSGKKMDQYMDHHDRLVLKQSFKTGDIPTAIASIQSLISRDTANKGLFDTLMNLYFQVKDFGSCYATADRFLKMFPEDSASLEYKGLAASSLNRYKDAIEAYAKLNNKYKNTKYLYELAIQAINAGDVQTGNKILSSIIENPASRTDVYHLRLEGNQFIPVPVLTVTLYYLGTFSELQQNTKQAKTFYEQALAVTPGFFLAQQNLAKLNKK